MVPRAWPVGAIGGRTLPRPSDGQLVLAALVGLYFLALFSQDWYWPRFGVPGQTGVGFLDARSITSAWECVSQGVDVVPVNPCDPLGRPFNTPRVWTLPSAFGLGQESTNVLGVLTACSFFAAAFAFLGRITIGDAAIYAAALCSPAVMLGVERGNHDLIVFAVLVAGLLLLRRPDSGTRLVAHAFFLLAAILKLFPIFAIAPLFRQPRRWLLATAAVVGSFAVYVVATFEDIQAIREDVQQEVPFSYGIDVLVEGAGWDVDSDVQRILFLAAALALAAGIVVVARRRTLLAAPPDRRAQTDLDAFWAGAGIYVASFALIQNFNYRLVFLTLTIPQLLRWSRAATPLVPAAGWGAAGVLLSLWLGASISFYPFGIGEWWEDVLHGFPYDEVVNWALFAFLAAAVALSVEANFRGWSRSGDHDQDADRAPGR